MSFWIRLGGAYTQISEAENTSQKIYVNAAFGNTGAFWQQAQRIFVYANGAWRRVYARTPSAPTNASLTVNGSSASSLSVSTTSLNCSASWSGTAADSGLPVEVKFLKSGTQVGTTQNITTGTTATQTITIAQGDSVYISAQLRRRNGQDTLAADDVYSSIATTNDILVTYAQASITSVSVSLQTSRQVQVTWSVNNPPSSNYSYNVYWSIDSTAYNNFAGSTTGTLALIDPGQNLYTTSQGNPQVSFNVKIDIVVNNVVVNTGYGSNSFYTEGSV